MHEHNHNSESCPHEHVHSHEDHIHCSCGCHDHHDHDEQNENNALKKIIFSGIFLIIGILLEHFQPSSALSNFKIPAEYFRLLYGCTYLAAYLICGKSVIHNALKNLRSGNIFGEQFLMSVASLGAVFLGEFAEAVAVMLFYNLGEFFQDYAVDKSRDSISSLMEIRPDHANLVKNGSVSSVAPEEISTGDIIEVHPGERIPLDGTVISGESFADTSALTGESIPRRISVGSEVLSGFINNSGVLRIKVTKLYKESAVSRILELTQNASSAKTKSEKFITKFSKIYTPVVCIAALCLALLPPTIIKLFKPELSADYGYSLWLYRSLSFLVVSCPCALVISVPLSFFSGIGAASKKGILIKGSCFIDALSKLKTVVFDKTGTLTEGVFEVSKIIPADDSISEEELLALAAHCEFYSSHPISISLKKSHSCEKCKDSMNASFNVSDHHEISGFGIEAIIEGKKISAGNEKLMKKNNVRNFRALETESGTIVYLAVEEKFAGTIVISDKIKENSAHAIDALKKAGIRKTVMLTGDTQSNAAQVAEDLGIDSFYAQLLPQDKVSRIEELLTANTKSSSEIVAFVGDGINDSPVLARADIGISMGNLGSDAAIEASDVVLMDDNLMKLSTAIKISKKTMAVVYQNIYFSILIKVLIMLLNATGIANMWFAVFGDVGVCFLTILNAIRLLK